MINKMLKLAVKLDKYAQMVEKSAEQDALMNKALDIYNVHLLVAGHGAGGEKLIMSQHELENLINTLRAAKLTPDEMNKISKVVNQDWSLLNSVLK